MRAVTSRFPRLVFRRLVLWCIGWLAAAVTTGMVTNAADLSVQLRRQVNVAEADTNDNYLTTIEAQTWPGQNTAVIVCDMWDSHHGFLAAKRTAELAPRIHQFVHHVRGAGGTIIHAPSGCMASYADHPARKRSQAIEIAKNLPANITQWCHRTDQENPDDYPIDQSDGGEDETPEQAAAWHQQLRAEGRDPQRPWQQQIETIEIDANVDFISDKGDEIWSILETHAVDNVMLVGVHTNMCVLGRPFGLRRMAMAGKNVVLVRDLTDTMYNPKSAPFVSHFTGTDLIVQYIERHVCPTISSDQLLGGKPFRFAADRRPTLVVLIAEREYRTHESLPTFAVAQLGKDYRVNIVRYAADDPNRFVGLESLADAAGLLVSVRRRTPHPEQMNLIRQFVQSGKPVIGIRTANHAFCLRNKDAPDGLADWQQWDADVFGGSYTNHHGNSLKSTIHVAEASKDHPILAGIDGFPMPQGGSLYKVSPVNDRATVLLKGIADGVSTEPVAWTFVRPDGGHSFYTSLGHVDDFQQPAFTQMLKQAIDHLVLAH